MHNLSLVFFTLLIQISVGIMGTTLFFNWISLEGGSFIPPTILLICLCLTALGLILATAHLGNPKNAPRAVSNFARSWLSREIIFINLFALSTALLWILTFTGFLKNPIPIELISLMLGCLSISAMSRVYRLKTIPVWNTIHTPIDFFGTALITGGAASAVIHVLISDTAHLPCLAFLICSCAGLCCKIAAIYLSISVQKKSRPLFFYASSRAKSHGQAGKYLFSSSLYTMGVVLVAAACPGWIDQPLFFLVPSLCLILWAEIRNRFYFYDSFCRLGL